ncbi:hypothetical protein GLW04_14220 [Halobacillus litoralis]|uniref:Uncharacterized protein n=1 Tax=Halobacillus litoralis TaxID=45668 RepID=A0A845DX65_9BACI|nr:MULTISPECIES: DUF5392 family protein [Halobacillus]MYL21055.1 hypothetical protein [Halobacillus litoralis]MYL31407.1 hypothetical protein [Halobacillus halophilus]MYL38438.1 hypothetical protein [Halobacillus litoralis]
MNLQTMKVSMPSYMAEEFEQMEKITGPKTKKMRRYSLLSLFMLPMAVFNIVSLVFFSETMPVVPVLLFSAAGAVALALQKEVKVLLKEVQELMVTYMKERMDKAAEMNPIRLNRFKTELEENPNQSVKVFAEFLEAERKWGEE